MGLVYKEVERELIVKELKARGYGEVGIRRYALAVNKPTGEFYESGSPKREFAWGITYDQLSAIQRYATDPADAANRCEQAGLGQEMQPIESVKQAAQPASGLSMEVAEKLIGNRVTNEVTKLIAPIHAELALMARRISDTLEVIAAMKPKKLGRPVGSKNKPKQKPDEAAPTLQA
jgi:hypothetical protein